MRIEQPWAPADATDAIRRLARSESLKLTTTEHIRDRLAERDLLMGDVLHCLRQGFVFREAEKATQQGLYKYAIESASPNSGARHLRVIVVPDEARAWMKLVTVMFVDEG